MVKLIINGAGGGMGKIVASVASTLPEEFKVVAGIDKFPPDPATVDFPVYDSFDACEQVCDVIIDFSMPEALPNVLEAAKKRNCCAVIATTGLREGDYELIKKTGESIPVFVSANMSLGVNLQIDLIKRAATLLGESFDIEIIEKHHNRKVDAPSGTAIVLANAISSQFSNGKDYIYERKSVRAKRNKRELGLHSVRGGTLAGEHQVHFIGDDEVIEIRHTAQSRRIFAVGALRAAAYLVGKEPKVYSMQEIVAEQTSVTSLTCEQQQSIITLNQVEYSPAVAAQIFEAIAAAGVNVDMISQTAPVESRVSISFTLPHEELKDAMSALNAYSVNMSYLGEMAKLCIEGAGMEHKPGVAAKVMRVLADQDIAMTLVTTSETKISVCINQGDVKRALDAMAAAFGL